MRKLHIYNTLTREVQEFIPQRSPEVSMYSCGPTVYDYQQIGNMRRYVGDDILIRVLRENGYDVTQVMNITDVGHLVSDEDTGEDKMEKGAKKHGMSVWDLAKKFEKQFFDSAQALNIQKPTKVIKATDAIQDQIELIQILEEKGYTYKIADGIYFNTSKFPDYFKLSRQNPEELREGARVEVVKGKKNPTDFALWKFSPKDQKREMEWESPWGVGFPGWHIECSAMSMKAFGPTLDIHTGGMDHISVHHTNEIAQSEAASGKQFVHYWVHHGFLLVEGEKMSKSLGNFITVQDVVREGYDPMSLRYLYLQTHYRSEMNFTWEALQGAQTALKDLYNESRIFGQIPPERLPKQEPSQKIIKKWEEFEDAINDDLNMPVALAVLHEGLKLAQDDFDKVFFLSKIDVILGLQLEQKGKEIYNFYNQLHNNPTPKQKEVLEMVKEREALRKQKKYLLADQLRVKVKKMGYDIEDVKGKGPEIRKI